MVILKSRVDQLVVDLNIMLVGISIKTFPSQWCKKGCLDDGCWQDCRIRGGWSGGQVGFRGNPQLPTQRITPPSPRLYPTHTLTPLNGIQCMLLTSTCPVAHSWNSPHCNACLLTEMCLLAFTATHPRVAKSDLNSTDAYFATKN